MRIEKDNICYNCPACKGSIIVDVDEDMNITELYKVGICDYGLQSDNCAIERFFSELGESIKEALDTLYETLKKIIFDFLPSVVDAVVSAVVDFLEELEDAYAKVKMEEQRRKFIAQQRKGQKYYVKAWRKERVRRERIHRVQHRK